MFTVHGKQVIDSRDGINGNESPVASRGLGIFDRCHGTLAWPVCHVQFLRASIERPILARAPRLQILAATACVASHLRGG